MRRIIVLGIVILVCASLAGATIGFFAGQEYTKNRFFRKWHGNGQFKERVMARLDERLDLDSQQYKEISRIVENKHEQLKAVKKEFKNKMKKIKSSTELEMRNCLKPDQQEEFDKMLEERKKRMRRMHKRRMVRKGGERWKD